MALTDKKYSSFHGKTGSDKNSMKAKFDEGHQSVYVDDPNGGDPAIVAMIYQIGQLEEELDYLRTEISDNKDKKSMTIGTASNQAMAGDTTTITSQQAKTITDNTTTAIGNTGEIKKLDTSVTNNSNTITSLIKGKLEVMLNRTGSSKQQLTCGVVERLGVYNLNFVYEDVDRNGKTITKTGSIQLK